MAALETVPWLVMVGGWIKKFSAYTIDGGGEEGASRALEELGLREIDWHVRDFRFERVGHAFHGIIVTWHRHGIEPAPVVWIGPIAWMVLANSIDEFAQLLISAPEVAATPQGLVLRATEPADRGAHLAYELAVTGRLGKPPAFADLKGEPQKELDEWLRFARGRS